MSGTFNVCKVKLFRHTLWRRLWGEEVSAYSSLTSALDGVSGQRHVPAALYPRGKVPQYPSSDKRLGGPQSRSGLTGYKENPLPRPGIKPWSSSP
jgi:hypothetical protein